MGNIPLPALSIRPPEQQPNVLDQFARIQQLKQQAALAPLQQQQLQQQVQEGQQNLQARQALNEAYKNSLAPDENGQPKFDIDKLQRNLAQGPAAYQIPQVAEGITKFMNAKADLQQKALTIQQTSQDMLGSAASAIKAASYDPTLAHSLLDTLPPSPQIQQLRQQIDNPQALKQLVDTAIQNSPKQRELGAQETTAQARQTTAQTEQQKLQAQMSPQSTLYAPSQASVALGTAPGAAQIQQGEAQQAALKAGAEEKAKMPGEMALAAQKQALSQGDPKTAAALLVGGQATLSELKSRGATPDFIAKTLYYANQQSGGKYNAQQADAAFDVAKSPANVAFFGSSKSLTDPGGTLDQLAKVGATIPQSQIPTLNSIADWEKAATGTGPIAHYAATALGVADDYAKVMGGGQGSDTSRLQALNLIKANQSPEGRAGALQGIRDAVQSQTSSRIGANPILKRMYGDAGGAGQAVPSAGISVGSIITQNGHKYKVTALGKDGKPSAADPVSQ